MGVSDYTCSVCGSPQSYGCGEATGEDCDVTGVGNDEAFLELLFFDAASAPVDPGSVLAARGRATTRSIKKWGYDWGAWEFVPSLNYREHLMGAGDRRGIWQVIPFNPATSDGHEVEVPIPDGQTLWVITFCPDCHALFVEGKQPPGAPCRLHLEAMAEHLGLDLDLDDTAAAVAAIAAVVAGLPPAKTAPSAPKKKKKMTPKDPLSQPLFSAAVLQKLQQKKGTDGS